ncbi:hemolysin family protein [Verrucomicrobiales bacterium BCK34]|nr:hemolysin family protein [Verrucomicrobiales bacterium BCK34]
MTTLSVLPFQADSLNSTLLSELALHLPGPFVSILILVAFLLLNALFVASEFALIKVHVSQIEEAAAEGRRGADTALKMSTNLNAYISACQLGISISSLIIGAIGTPFVASYLEPLFNLINLPEESHSIVGFLISLGILAVIHMTFGELIPRVFGLRRTVGTVISCSKPVTFFYYLFAAPIWAINKASDFLLRSLFRIQPMENGTVTHTAAEIRLLVEETGRAKEVTPTEQTILINALELNELIVRDILTPRNDVVALDVHRTFRENLEIALESKHTRFPLVDRHLDSTLGLIHIKDLLGEMDKEAPNLFALKRDLMRVSEDLPLDEMLKRFLAERAHLALVVDEFGGSIGLVMFDDVLDQVVGEIRDEFDDPEETGFERVSEDEFNVEGWLPLHELCDEVDDLDLEDPDVSTVGGYLTNHLGRLPVDGEETRIAGYRVEVIEADDRSIQHLRFIREDELPEEEASAEEADEEAQASRAS